LTRQLAFCENSPGLPEISGISDADRCRIFGRSKSVPININTRYKQQLQPKHSEAALHKSLTAPFPITGRLEVWPLLPRLFCKLRPTTERPNPNPQSHPHRLPKNTGSVASHLGGMSSLSSSLSWALLLLFSPSRSLQVWTGRNRKMWY